MRELRSITLLIWILIVGASVSAPSLRAQGERGRPSAQAPAPGAGEHPTPSPVPKEEKPAEKEKPEEPPVVTHHQITAQGKVLKYTATTGMLPIRNADGETEAHIFFIAYTLDEPPAGRARPLMFSFNGGPGSSSVWLHLGAIGPKRVKMLDGGDMPSPPFQVIDNDATWLDQTDLVFIDPVGTGYSRPVKKELGSKFWGVQGDIESVGEFIRLYLSRYERWSSPLFLVGESYGTTRAAGLSGYLVQRGVALNGIVLISSVLNFETLGFTRGNDLPYVLYLPSFASTAWYHKRLAPELEQDFEKLRREVEQWAGAGYAEALAKGDAMTAEERQAVIDRLARYTGLSKGYIDDSNLRITQGGFCKELLRDQKRTVGRLDSRFKGIDVSGVSDRPDYDPSEAAIRPPFTAMFNNYIRAELGYKSDLEYYILGGGVRNWEWGSAGEGFLETSSALRTALVRNPYMHVFVASGYFDLATPYFATQYTLSHMGLDPSVRGNVATGEYEAGHMMYIKSESLAKLKGDVSSFIAGTLR